MVSRNPWNSSVPVPTTKGGTAQSTYVDGQLLIGNSTGNTLSKSTLTAGTNCSITNGSGSITINSSAAGTWELISSQTSSSSASIIFTGLSSYTGNLALEIDSIRPATSGAVLRMYVSTNNGSTYATSGYYSGLNYYGYTSSSFTNSNTTTYIVMSSGIVNTETSYAGIFFLYNINESSAFQMCGSASWLVSPPTWVNGIMTARGATSVNAIKLQMSSGNLTQGTFSLYRIKDS